MPIPVAAFTGFPPEAFTFLAGLEAHNERTWFLPRKELYESAIVTPALAFAAALGEALQKFSPSVQAEPLVGGSLFRIQRDVRFSADKHPYKTHVGIRLRDNAPSYLGNSSRPLYYVEFDTRRMRLGAGMKTFDPPTLASYRNRLVRGLGASKLRKALLVGEQAGAIVMGERTVRPPAGHGGSPQADLLRWKGLFAMLEEPLPPEIGSRHFVGYCCDLLRPLAPLFAELRHIALAGTAGR